MKDAPEKKSVEALRKYKEMWDAGEFEFNHHLEDDLGKKPINPQRIWNVFIEPLLAEREAERDTYWKERVREARSEGEAGERCRIRNGINHLTYWGRIAGYGTADAFLADEVYKIVNNRITPITNEETDTNPTEAECDYCEGLGYRTVSVENEYGLGNIEKEECSKCRGSGTTKPNPREE